MRVIRAETAGFCMGVGLALRKLDSVVIENAGKREGAAIMTLGPIIHNPQVLEDYGQKGVGIASTPDDVPGGSCVVIRAHGIPRQVEHALREHDVRIIDATCPKVKRAQLLIAEQAGLGRTLLLFGEEDHPEVKGLLSYAGEAVVFESLEELEEMDIGGMEQCFLAAQTTQDREAFERITANLKERCGDIPILETICDATRERQQEAVDIAKQVDAVVVVGGFSSGNTRRLVDVALEQGVFAVHVETPEQLPLEKLVKYATIGLTGGASTPKHLIDTIQERLEAL